MTFTPSHGEKLKIGGIQVTSLHTPCHTQDSICWFMEQDGHRAVFTGDTLFNSGELGLRDLSCRFDSVGFWRGVLTMCRVRPLL